MANTNTTANVRCIECGRTLTSPTSIARGRGKGCAAKVRRTMATATTDGFTTKQVDAARELIEDAGVVRLRGHIYLTVSTNGERVHRTTATRCTCNAGIKEKACYHQLAVRMRLGGYGLAA